MHLLKMLPGLLVAPVMKSLSYILICPHSVKIGIESLDFESPEK
jgi:hypothetical protein